MILKTKDIKMSFLKPIFTQENFEDLLYTILPFLTDEDKFNLHLVNKNCHIILEKYYPFKIEIDARWFWEHKNNWLEYPPCVCEDIEKHHIREHAVFDKYRIYELNLVRLKQINKFERFRRRNIKRQGKEIEMLRNKYNGYKSFLKYLLL